MLGVHALPKMLYVENAANKDILLKYVKVKLLQQLRNRARTVKYFKELCQHPKKLVKNGLHLLKFVVLRSSLKWTLVQMKVERVFEGLKKKLKLCKPNKKATFLQL